MRTEPRSRTSFSGGLGGVLLLLAVAFLGCGSRNETQTVVKVRAATVVVRYEDGRLAEVENDMGYELVPGQEVKVVENCDGALHVAMAYPAP